jgi:predicted MFS family arabinose efflux permease
VSAATGEPVVPLYRNRDFLLLWGGEVVSTLGSQVSLVAFPLLVLATTHSPAKAGLVGFANQVPVLALYLPTGVLVDRHDRRTIMIVSSLVAACALASVPVALALGELPFDQIIVVALIAGARQVIYSTAEQGALPLVVADSQVAEAVTRNQARSEAATLAGPPLGGLLFGFARLLPFAVDAVSYLFSALGALYVRTPLQQPRTEKRQHPVAEVRHALRWFWSQSFLRTSALAVAASNFTTVAVELVLIIRARQAGASPAAVGGMLSIIGAGGLTGALLAIPITRRVSMPVIVIGLFWIDAALLPLLVMTRSPYLLGAIMGVSVLGGPAWNAVIVGARLTLTPDHLRGRVISVARLISGSLLAVGPLTAGLLTQAVGSTDTILALAVWQLLVALGATATKSLRDGLGSTSGWLRTGDAG